MINELLAPRSLRRALMLALAMLCAGLISTFVLMYRQVSRARVVVAPPAPTAQSALPEQVQELLTLEESEKKNREAVLGALRELHSLLDLLAKSGGSGGSSSLAERMRQAADRTVALSGLRLEEGERAAASFEESRAAFTAAAKALRQKAGWSRERAVADEVVQKFEDLCRLGAEWQAASDREAEALHRVSLPPEKESRLVPVKPLLHSAGSHSPSTRAWLLIGLSASVSLAAAILIAVLAVRGLARPLAHLIEVARDVMHGRVRRPASPALAGDLRELAEAFNKMTEAQRQAEERLRLSNDSLELKVSARTAELFRANRALKEEGEQRARAERDFQQAQKMDALGKLAGSIAHDFNNLLTVIIGGAESVQKQLGRTHPAGALLQTVQKAGERAAGLTRPLLTFSRSQVLEVEKVSLNDAAEEAAKMMHRLLGVNVEFRMELEPNLPPVRTNPNQLQQVLINLGVNARDAMDGMGNLTIVTRTADLSGRAPQGRPGGARPWLELIVRDTGCGMDAATKARIFEPFFTTKPAGKGTGLGLATVFGIVKQSGGFMEVESAPGDGTSFHVFWPAMTPEECQAAAVIEVEEAPIASAATGQETLLLVDDEDDIRELAALSLEEHGYKVLTASHAEAALLLGEKHGSEIRALITDVVMPGINGVQLAELLLRIVPDLRVLFVSGHSNEAISGETLRATQALYLQKPYRSHALLAKVSEVLAAPRRRAGAPATGRFPSEKKRTAQLGSADLWADVDAFAGVT